MTKGIWGRYLEVGNLQLGWTPRSRVEGGSHYWQFLEDVYVHLCSFSVLSECSAVPCAKELRICSFSYIYILTLVF